MSFFQVEDLDLNSLVSLRLEGEDSSEFTIDDDTGDIFLLNPAACGGDGCVITVTANDVVGDSDPREIKVRPSSFYKFFIHI